MIKNYVLAVMLSCAASASFGQMKNFTAGKVATAPVVDGDIDSQYMFSDNNAGSGMAVLESCIDNATSNCIATSSAVCDKTTKWSAVYNETSLFIVAQVKDAALGAGDAIELFFSMANARTSNCPDNWPRAYDATTFQIVTSDPTVSPMTFSSPNGQVGNVGAAASKKTADGYIMEFEILWSEADFLSGLKPVAGRKIGFDISNNQGVLTRTAQSMWNQTGTNRNWTESTNFGTLTLGDMITSTNSITSLISNVTIAPNPAANQVSVVINAKQQDEVAISIINTLSQKVYSNNQAVVAGQTKHEISTSELPNGIYTVVISKGNLNTTEKLVINK